jgi:putative DNA primase/helicase
MASGQWREILVAAGIADALLSRPKTLGPCPVCGGKSRFRFDDKYGHGNWICHICDADKGKECGGGNGYRLLELFNNWTWYQAFLFVEQWLGGAPPLPSRPVVQQNVKSHEEEVKESRLKSRGIWDKTTPLNEDTPAARYLRSRGFELDVFPRVLRLHTPLPYWIEDGSDGKTKWRSLGDFWVMVAGLQFIDGSFAGVHLTYLTEDGRKAPVTEIANNGQEYSAKKLMTKGADGAAIRLFDAKGGELGVAEGIENGFAAHFMNSGLPTWAASNSGMLKKIAIPDHVELLHIFGDTDKRQKNGRRAGQDAAKELNDRRTAEGKRCRRHFPARIDLDFTDMWNARAAKAQRAVAA